MLSTSRRPASPRPCGSCGKPNCTGTCAHPRPHHSKHAVWMAAAVAGFAMGATLLTAFSAVNAQSRPSTTTSSNAAIVAELRKVTQRLEQLEKEVKGGFSNCRAEARMCTADRDEDSVPDCVEQCKETADSDEAFKRCIDMVCRKPEPVEDERVNEPSKEQALCRRTCEQSYESCRKGVETDAGVQKCKTALTTCTQTCNE